MDAHDVPWTLGHKTQHRMTIQDTQASTGPLEVGELRHRCT